ncbi:hypothetical protein D4R42_00720 [bacterium]|nr:MAG: hypothetical protein D4R42_00720 [bacterium]
MPNRAVSIVLLLGSYDRATKDILDKIKEEIAKIFAGKTFAFLLENLEVYTSDRFEVLVEIEDGLQITIYLFEGKSLRDVLDLPLKAGEKPDDIVYSYLKQKFNVSAINKQSVEAKFDTLMGLAVEIFLIRHKEETRGGEYVELMHALFRGLSEKIWFFKKQFNNYFIDAHGIFG